MNYISKPASEFSSNYHFEYEKPVTCPYCGLGTDAPIIAKSSFSIDGKALLAASCRCTACQKTFFFACVHTDGNSAPNVCLYPDIQMEKYNNKNLAAISEHFIDMYNQALTAEFHNNIDLAAIGYRSALEILVKDFAINELKRDPDEVVRKSLCDAIGEYLGQDDLVKTADVVRILGNDYTHYGRKYPQYDFGLLKSYMEIFLKQIEAKYMAMHPPVSRTS